MCGRESARGSTARPRTRRTQLLSRRGSLSHRLHYPAQGRTHKRDKARDIFCRCVWRPVNDTLCHPFHGLGPRLPQSSVTIRWSIFHLETSLQNTSRFGPPLSVTKLPCRVYRSGFAKSRASASSRPVRRKAVRFKRSPSPATKKSSSRRLAKSTPPRCLTQTGKRSAQCGATGLDRAVQRDICLAKVGPKPATPRGET